LFSDKILLRNTVRIHDFIKTQPASGLLVRNSQADFPVKATGTAEGGVEGVGPVGSTNHQHMTVHTRIQVCKTQLDYKQRLFWNKILVANDWDLLT